MELPELLLTTICGMFVLTSSTPVALRPESFLFLDKYGYLSATTKTMRSGAAAMKSNTLSNALKEFQRFAGLNQTGTMNQATLDKMKAPRCGDKDIIGRSTAARKKRYALQGSQWEKKFITYKIGKFPSRVNDQNKVRKELLRAFEVWSNVIPLSFGEKKRGQSDIDIRFEQGEHGDGDPFDGPDSTLAHAFYPEFGGDVHFDDDEKWTLNKKTGGTNLFQIAAHEIGHSLGLAHSDNINAIMNPYPPYEYKPTFKLHSDDITAIQRIYGTRREQKSMPLAQGKSEDTVLDSNTRGATESPYDLCKNATFDTITQTKDGDIYIFKGDFYWKLLPKSGFETNYPRKISEDWDGLPGNIDASFTKPNGRTFFIKGKIYWRFINKKMEPGYPKSLNDKFRGIPASPDAAFHWSADGNIYFFKGNQYWQFDSNTKPSVSSKYPKSITQWKGIPNAGINAAFERKNKNLYFFKGYSYYRMKDLTTEVESGNPPYPRSTAVWWFAC